MTKDAFNLAKRFRLSLDSPGGAIASDADVLQRFLLDRSDEAFTQLVHRHGPLVWGLCRRMLHHHADAEDAFQATFLALAQHAGRIEKQGSLSGWLYGAAWRIIHKIKRTRYRAQQREKQLARPEEQTDESTWDQTIREVMDAELARLPAHYREPLLLCYLQGQSHALAAQTLGWPIGTVAGRLSRAKELLRSRLIRRGVAPSIAASLGADLAQAKLPAELIEKTLHTLHAGGTSTITQLAKGAVSTMVLTKWLTGGVIGIGVTLGAGWCYSAFSLQGESKTKTAPESLSVQVRQSAEHNDYQLIQGLWRHENRHEVTDRLKWAEDLTFRGRKYASSQYGVDKDGNLGERGYESEAMEFVLEPNQSPKQMELQQIDPTKFHAGTPRDGIERLLCTYELNGDVLTIYYGGNVPYHFNQQGKLVLDRNSPQATFPKPGDPNVRRQVYRRITRSLSEQEKNNKIMKKLRQGEVAHAVVMPGSAIQKTHMVGDKVDVTATTKVADKDTFKTETILEDIELLSIDPWKNKDGSDAEATRVYLRVTRAQALTIKFHQDTAKLELLKRRFGDIKKTTATSPANTVSDLERKLLDEQLNACEDVVKLRLDAYKAGKETINFLLEAIKKHSEVKLDLAGNQYDARQTALKEAIKYAKEVENIADAKHKAGSATLLELRTVQVERLNYELRLLRLEKK